MSAESLSVCIITLNEERRLPRALASVRPFAAEVVVVDSGSTDGTRELAAAAGARVIEQPWLGFGAQRNVALDHATGDWVLELDADEWCSEGLADELRAFLALPPPAPFRMALVPMRQRFLGRVLGPSGHYPFYRSRLFRRGAYRHDPSRPVHEGLWPRERPWVLRGDLEHELAGDLREAWADLWAYARLESQAIGSVPPRALMTGTLLRPTLKLLYRVLVLGAWRDGSPGVLRAVLESLGDALTWMLAWRRGLAGGSSEAADGEHFGRRPPRDGPVFLLAVGNPSRPAARAWLDDAVRAGAWVCVICSERDAAPVLAGDAALRVRTVPRAGPLAVLRALDAEEQLAPVDAHVALDRGGAALLALAPFADVLVRPGLRPAAELVRSLRLG